MRFFFVWLMTGFGWLLLGVCVLYTVAAIALWIGCIVEEFKDFRWRK